MPTPLLKIMIQLAKCDGGVSEEEHEMICKLAAGNGIPRREIDKLFEEQEGKFNLGALSDDKKFEYLYHIVLLMKVDDRLYPAELNFCLNLAGKLGYRDTVILELISRKYDIKTSQDEKDRIKAKVQQFLL